MAKITRTQSKNELLRDIGFCPAAGPTPITCTRADWDRRCGSWQKAAKDKKIGKTYYPQCAECCGEYIPGHVTFKTIDELLAGRQAQPDGETMSDINGKDGACELCGEKKRLSTCYDQQLCSNCRNVQTNAKLRPDVVIASLRKFGNLGEVVGADAESAARIDAVTADLKTVNLEVMKLQEERDEFRYQVLGYERLMGQLAAMVSDKPDDIIYADVPEIVAAYLGELAAARKMLDVGMDGKLPDVIGNYMGRIKDMQKTINVQGKLLADLRQIVGAGSTEDLLDAAKRLTLYERELEEEQAAHRQLVTKVAQIGRIHESEMLELRGALQEATATLSAKLVAANEVVAKLSLENSGARSRESDVNGLLFRLLFGIVDGSVTGISADELRPLCVPGPQCLPDGQAAGVEHHHV